MRVAISLVMGFKKELPSFFSKTSCSGTGSVMGKHHEQQEWLHAALTKTAPRTKQQHFLLA